MPKLITIFFYGTYVGGTNYTETPWWDNLWYGDADISTIAFDSSTVPMQQRLMQPTLQDFS